MSDTIVDAVFAIGNVIMFVALILSLKNPPSESTSFMTGVVLTAFAACYLHLGLWFAATSIAMTALLWFVLGLKAHAIKRKRRVETADMLKSVVPYPPHRTRQDQKRIAERERYTKPEPWKTYGGR